MKKKPTKTETETAKEEEADDKADDGEGSPKEVGSKKSTKSNCQKKKPKVEVEEETDEDFDKDSDWHNDPANWSKEDLLSKMVELSAKVKELEELNSELFSYKETVDQMNLDKQIKKKLKRFQCNTL